MNSFNIEDEDLLNNYRVVFQKNNPDGVTYSLSTRAFIEVIKRQLNKEDNVTN